jgi:hypothetical protein
MNVALYNSKAGFAFALSRVLAGVGAVLLAASAVALPDALIVRAPTAIEAGRTIGALYPQVAVKMTDRA